MSRPLTLPTAAELFGRLSAPVLRRLFTSNGTPAALFRTIEGLSPTLLIDEAADFIYDNDELRSLLNSAHTRTTAVIIRTVETTTSCERLLDMRGAAARRRVMPIAATDPPPQRALEQMLPGTDPYDSFIYNTCRLNARTRSTNMGMDVVGTAPTAEVGDYFRNSAWLWHPLWHYCRRVAPEITEKVQNGHANDGDGLNATDAPRLAAQLREELAAGRTAAYARERQESLNAVQDVPCLRCSTEVRAESPKIKADPALCNWCKGSGRMRPPATFFGFDVTNVERFADFLEHSGGFEIW